MNCDECRQTLMLAMFGEADEAESAAASRHVLDCPACRAWKDDITDLTDALKRGAPALPDEARVKLVETVHRAFEPERSVIGRIAAAVLATAAALVAGVMLWGLFGGDTDVKPVTPEAKPPAVASDDTDPAPVDVSDPEFGPDPIAVEAEPDGQAIAEGLRHGLSDDPSGLDMGDSSFHSRIADTRRSTDVYKWRYGRSRSSDYDRRYGDAMFTLERLSESKGSDW